MSIKLYGSYTSPFVRHCRVALAQTGLKHEFVEADQETIGAHSPTNKVPFLEDGKLRLTDSCAILKYIREQAGQKFFADIQAYENFTLVNTTLDSAINLFLLEKEGLSPEQVGYLNKQKNRVASGLKEINQRVDASQVAGSIERDDLLRCACFVDWGLFRNRFSVDEYSNLRQLLENANQVAEFAATAPPR